jgi:predicted metal-dependent hydrolase
MQGQLPFSPSNDEARSPNDQCAMVFVRHPRARRYVIRVSDDGSLRVTVPRWGSKREAAAFVEQERAWIAKQQRRVEQNRLARAGRPTLLDSLADQAALKARAKRELPLRLLELAAAHRLSVARISIRNQRWRWGSCSRRGHICLNWRLVVMPPDVRDYVLIHELMHLKRMDHSAKFWKLVAEICPEYQSARAYLRAFSRD